MVVRDYSRKVLFIGCLMLGVSVKAMEPTAAEQILVCFENVDNIPLHIRVSEVNKEALAKLALIHATLGVSNSIFKTVELRPYLEHKACITSDWEINVSQPHKREDYGTVTIPASFLMRAKTFYITQDNIVFEDKDIHALPHTFMLFRKTKSR